MAKKDAELTETVETVESVEVAKKGNKKVLYAIIAVIVIAALAVGGFFGYKALKGHNPAKVTSDAIRGLNDKIEDAKDEVDGLDELFEDNDKVEVDAKITANIPMLGKDSYTANILVQSDSKNESAIVDLKAAMGSKNILDLDAYLEGKIAYFKLADAMKNYYKYDLSEYIDEFTKEMNEAASSEQMAKLAKLDVDVEDVIEYLADAVDKNITKKDFDSSKEKISVNGEEVSTTKYSTKVTMTKLKNILDDFLKSVLKDDDLIEAIAVINDQSESEVRKSIQELIDEKVTDDGSYFVYNVYVTSMGNVVAYEISIDKNTSIMITNDEDITKVIITSGKEEISIKIDESEKDKTIISFNYNGVKATLTIKENLKTIKKNKSYKYTLDLDASVEASGASISGSISIDADIKAIDKINSVDTKNAIDVAKMDDEQKNTFLKELQNSSLFSLMSALN